MSSNGLMACAALVMADGEPDAPRTDLEAGPWQSLKVTAECCFSVTADVKSRQFSTRSDSSERIYLINLLITLVIVYVGPGARTMFLRL